MGRNRGIALVWAAIMLFVMIGIVGLSIDWGKCTWNVGQMQNAADAAALAGAHFVKYDQVMARDRAIQLGLANVADGTAVSLDRNDGNAKEGEIVLGRWIRQSREFIVTTENPNACKVVVKRDSEQTGKLALLFGPLFGTKEVAATRPAIALSIASTGAGIICLAEDPTALPGVPLKSGLLGRSAKIDLTGPDGIPGDIQVNARDSGNWESVRVDGTSTEIAAGDINAHGTTDPDADDSKAWADVSTGDTLSVNPQSPIVPDPLLDAEPPDIGALPTRTEATITGGTLTLEPGWYPGGINMSNGSITLNPGVYAFGGGKDGKSGFAIGGGSVTGNGVMIYVTGDETNGVKYGEINVGANAVLDLVSRGDATVPKQIDGAMGVVLWQDRENDNYAKIVGGGDCDMTGTIYVGYAILNLSGTFGQMGNQIIAGALDISGDVTLSVAYDGRNFIKAQRSVLVE